MYAHIKSFSLKQHFFSNTLGTGKIPNENGLNSERVNVKLCLFQDQSQAP